MAKQITVDKRTYEAIQKLNKDAVNVKNFPKWENLDSLTNIVIKFGVCAMRKAFFKETWSEALISLDKVSYKKLN